MQITANNTNPPGKSGNPIEELLEETSSDDDYSTSQDTDILDVDRPVPTHEEVEQFSKLMFSDENEKQNATI